MVSTISKQGGRRYGQMSSNSQMAVWLPGFGTSAGPAPPTFHAGSRYRWGFRAQWFYAPVI